MARGWYQWAALGEARPDALVRSTWFVVTKRHLVWFWRSNKLLRAVANIENSNSVVLDRKQYSVDASHTVQENSDIFIECVVFTSEHAKLG